MRIAQQPHAERQSMRIAQQPHAERQAMFIAHIFAHQSKRLQIIGDFLDVSSWRCSINTFAGTTKSASRALLAI